MFSYGATTLTAPAGAYTPYASFAGPASSPYGGTAPYVTFAGHPAQQQQQQPQSVFGQPFGAPHHQQQQQQPPQHPFGNPHPFGGQQGGHPFGGQQGGSPFGGQQGGSPFGGQQGGHQFGGQQGGNPFGGQQGGSPFGGSPFGGAPQGGHQGHQGGFPGSAPAQQAFPGFPQQSAQAPIAPAGGASSFFGSGQPFVIPQPSKPKAEQVLGAASQRLDLVGNQLCAFAAEVEEIKGEVVNANSVLDGDLRQLLQQANDEIYQLRNQLSEATERKVIERN